MAATKSSIWFWSDWESDPTLRICSFAAQGLWMRMLCIAARHDPTGYVAVNRVGLDTDAIARMTGGEPREVRSLIEELERNGVFTRDRNGTIYNRRMLRDEKRRRSAQANGKLGGNPTLRNKTKKTDRLNPDPKPPPKPGPKPISSSFTLTTSSSDAGEPATTMTVDELHSKLVEAAGGHVAQTIGIEVVKPILDLMAQGCDLENHILPAIRSRVPRLSRPLGNWGASFLRDEIFALKEQEAARVYATPKPSEPTFDFGGGFTPTYSLIRSVYGRGEWLPDWGPRPGESGCRIPPDLLAEIMGKVPA